MKAIFALLLVITFNVQADSLWLEVNGISKHSQDEYHTGWEKDYGTPTPGTHGWLFDESVQKHYHFKETTKRFQEVNMGLGLTYEMYDWFSIRGGFFENSFNKTSVYGAINLQHKFRFSKLIVAPNVSTGVTTGYDDTPVHDGEYRPMVVPGVMIGSDTVRINVGYVPGKLINQKEGVDVVTVQFQLRIK